MARKIDPAAEMILKELKLDPKQVLWDCHGTWVMYHRALERVAAEQGITFEKPALLENNGAQKSVAICVTGHRGDRMEWSIGEASPGNCKNAYPYAMAEKRGKDRVILKLIGLHGLIYSEDEMDEPQKPAAPDLAVIEEKTTEPGLNAAEMIAELRVYEKDTQCTREEVNAVLTQWKNAGFLAALSEADKARVQGAYQMALRAKPKRELTLLDAG